MDYKILDAHMHIWNLEENEYEWLKGNTTIIGRTHEIPEIEPQMKEAGISASILVQAANTYEDTEYMVSNAAMYPWIKGVVGWVPLLDPDETARKIAEYKNNPYIKGIRHLIHDEPDNRWLLRNKVVESLKVLADNQVPFDVVGILPEHLRCVLEVGDKLPELKMVLDHLNHPPVASGNLGEWGELITQVAQNPNVYAKISGLGTITEKPEKWSENDIQPYVEHALAKFGTERCFCGGDWPVSRLAGNYTYTWSKYKSLLQKLLGDDELIKVFQKNAEFFYGVKV